MVYIWHHLGLGDYIICNGLIRSLTKPDKDYTIFIQEHNLPSVRFMYKDLPNIHFHSVNSWSDMTHTANLLEAEGNEVLRIKFVPFQGFEFDEYFYISNGIDFQYRWTNFLTRRDADREMVLFSKYNVTEGNYVFIHDDSSRSFNIDTSHIQNQHLPVVRPIPGLTDNIFDYCYLMQHSIESHFIDSSFRLLFDSYKLRDTNIYYHINLMDGVIKDRDTKSNSFLPFTVI